jgi:Protein of unknown function (DUF1479)
MGTRVTPLPPLPSWSTTPTDTAAATAQVKAALRDRLRVAGRSAEEVFAVMAERVGTQVAEVAAELEEGRNAWPVVDYADIEQGTVPAAVVAKLRTRGCMIVRGHFERQQALDWDLGIEDYVKRNRFFENYRGAGDDFFASVESKPEIYPIYWSHAQMEARQSDRMTNVQRFLNSMWTSSSEGVEWFDPNRDSMYPDRIRRRPPGTTSAGLRTHMDAGTLDLWMTSENQQAFHHLFDGTVEQFDPWSAAHRTSGPQFVGSTKTSVFRTFQGWTALSDMDHDQGVLQSIPIVDVMGYLMLRPLLSDVPDDDLCGVKVGRAFPASDHWHAPLMRALAGIPDVRAGDSAWWHCDMVHAVASVENQKGWGNVMYIPAAPWCERNERYSHLVRAAFLDGSSPDDFPEEHYERTWPDRFAVESLNNTGRRAIGMV